MDMYAPFLYDALLVWANLATQVLSEGGDPSNGTLLFQRARFYEGRGKDSIRYDSSALLNSSYPSRTISRTKKQNYIEFLFIRITLSSILNNFIIAR